MTEPIQTTEKTKKPGLLRRIIRWLWVVLLSVLLILGLFFAAPWKAISLIAIFLAAATILPRIYRKWFWACVGIVIIVLVIWIFLPEDNKGWKPYTFDNELAELQAQYAIPDSENAAVIYNQILADWKQKEPNEPNLPERWFDRVHYDYWLTEDQPEIAAYIKYRYDTIKGLLQAAKFEKCAFPIVANIKDFGNNMDRISASRQFDYLLEAAGNNDMAEGKRNEAVEKYCAIIQMGRHLSQQPAAMDTLIGIASEGMGLQVIVRFAVSTDVDESALSKAEQTVSKIKHDLSSDLPGFIESDKLILKNMCGSLYYEVNSKGEVRFCRDPYASIREMSDINAMCNGDKSGYWWKILFRAYIIHYWFYAPSTPEKLGEIINSSYETNYAMTKPDFDWPKEPPEVPIQSLFQWKFDFRQQTDLLARTSEKLYLGLHKTYLRNLTEQRGALLIIAMRRYKNTNGHWPLHLEDVNNLAPAEIFIDPLNNDSFIYKLTDDNFTLYSKGKNGIDDGGKRETSSFGDKEVQNKGCDDFLIWPIKSNALKQQEVKEDDEKQ